MVYGIVLPTLMGFFYEYNGISFNILFFMMTFYDFFLGVSENGQTTNTPKLRIFMGENEDKPADGTGGPGYPIFRQSQMPFMF